MRDDWRHLLTALFNIVVIAAGVGFIARLIVAAFTWGAAHV